jgi:predicted signal transduction protein with EAL and GGDEF domain
VDDLLREADTAMYRAKAAGKGRYDVFDEELRLQLLARSDLEAALRGAVDRGEFHVLFQPILRLSTGRLAGFEALLRWQRADRVWEPHEFLPAVEETGLILPIGSVVLREACRQARLVAAARDRRGLLPVSVQPLGQAIPRSGAGHPYRGHPGRDRASSGGPAAGRLGGRDHRERRDGDERAGPPAVAGPQDLHR